MYPELLVLKTIKYSTNAKNAKKKKKKSLRPIVTEKLINNFPSVYKFCNGDLNKFVLLLIKGVYLYEYMDSWKKIDETWFPDKKYFYSKINLKDITNKIYPYAQKVWKIFEIKTLSEYHDLYAQSDTLLLADVFENFRDKCIEIDELDELDKK